jgi:hypothetical protein
MAVATLLKAAEAAERLRRPVETLRYWRWCGEGPPSFKIGRAVLYDGEMNSGALSSTSRCGIPRG